MLPELHEATEEWEPAVRDLFASRGVLIRESAWADAFARTDHVPADSGIDPAARGMVAVLEGQVLGFFLAIPRQLAAAGDHWHANIVSDFLLADHRDADLAARVILEEYPRRFDVCFAAGWSPAGTALLRKWNWRFARPFAEWRREPARKRLGKPPAPPPVAAGEPTEPCGIHFRYDAARWHALREGRTTFAAEGGGQLRLSTSAGEFLVEDARGEAVPLAAAAALAADGLQARAVWPSMSARLDAALPAAGFVRAPERWGLFWTLGKSRPRGLAEELVRHRDFEFWAGDFCL